MEKPNYLINDICNPNMSYDELNKTLFSHGIKTKLYDNDNLILVYNNYDLSVKSDLQRECRSLVLDKTTYKIVSYSCEIPILNNDGLDYIKKSGNTIEYVTECYEGSCLSLFCHNNKWYLSTRKHLNSVDDNLSHKYILMYEMFEEVLIESGYKSFDDFTKILNSNYSYYFVLIHYKNKHIIDYSVKFENENYKKLVLISVKDSHMQENINLQNIDFLGNHIFLPHQKIDTINNFLFINMYRMYNIPNCEGIIIHKWDNKNNKFRLIKLQYNNYIFHSLYKINKYYGSIY